MTKKEAFGFGFFSGLIVIGMIAVIFQPRVDELAYHYYNYAKYPPADTLFEMHMQWTKGDTICHYIIDHDGVTHRINIMKKIE
jgi:hypothetical protein